MFLRNGLLVAATLTAAVRLWRSTVPKPTAPDPLPDQVTRANEPAVSP